MMMKGRKEKRERSNGTIRVFEERGVAGCGDDGAPEDLEGEGGGDELAEGLEEDAEREREDEAARGAVDGREPVGDDDDAARGEHGREDEREAPDLLRDLERLLAPRQQHRRVHRRRVARHRRSSPVSSTVKVSFVCVVLLCKHDCQEQWMTNEFARTRYLL